MLNHAPGNTPEARDARNEKILLSTENNPEVGTRLADEDEAAKRDGNTMCAVLYLLRQKVPALGKKRTSVSRGPYRPLAAES